MKTKMYLVSYSAGEWDDYREYQLFVTQSLELAKSYVEKFRRIIPELKEFYEQKAKEWGEIDETSDNFSIFSHKEYNYFDVNTARFEEIELRS